MDTIWMLNEFGTEHKLLNWNTLKVTLRPDRNAIVRARVQNTYKDKDERSVIDVLMQSTFMNVGAQNTYDSLIDKRIPKYNEDDSGLIDIEKNFAEELSTGKGKICVTYQKIDDEGKSLELKEIEEAEDKEDIKLNMDEVDKSPAVEVKDEPEEEETDEDFEEELEEDLKMEEEFEEGADL